MYMTLTPKPSLNQRSLVFQTRTEPAGIDLGSVVFHIDRLNCNTILNSEAAGHQLYVELYAQQSGHNVHTTDRLIGRNMGRIKIDSEQTNLWYNSKPHAHFMKNHHIWSFSVQGSVWAFGTLNALRNKHPSLLIWRDYKPVAIISREDDGTIVIGDGDDNGSAFHIYFAILAFWLTSATFSYWHHGTSHPRLPLSKIFSE